ncbi:MAG: Crp/Fnr family transcriptional regulator [Halobacteria archaeon]|nr:Crp/Fnr family transcriptional regulator [Halobacteria archaeon]
MKTEQQLLDLFAGLDEDARSSLLAFAEFLSTRRSAPPVAAARPPVAVPEPEKIERPADESIVAALKRLAKTYPMLDKSEMLGATSDLVATHVMQGTEPVQVIDKLEAIFATHYSQLLKRSGG